MFACKDIFAKPSITQAHDSAQRATPKGLRSKTFCVYYTIMMLTCQQVCENFAILKLYKNTKF